MLLEQERFGWRSAIIVSTGGFKSFRNYTEKDLENKRVELRDKSDLIGWLEGYEPNGDGLWLPKETALGLGLNS